MLLCIDNPQTGSETVRARQLDPGLQHGELAFPSLHFFLCFKQHVFVYLEIAIEEQPVGRLLFEVRYRGGQQRTSPLSTVVSPAKGGGTEIWPVDVS